MSEQASMDPSKPNDEQREEAPAPKKPTHPFGWSAGSMLADQLNRASVAGESMQGSSADDEERRRICLGMLELAWKANPKLTLGQLLERIFALAGHPDLAVVSDVALIHSLALEAQPVEPF